MLDERPEISETLVWMLQSRQVGNETLVHTIVHEYYAKLYQLAISLLDKSDSDNATRLTDRAVLEAIANTHRYREEMSVLVWLYRKVVAGYKRLTWNGKERVS